VLKLTHRRQEKLRIEESLRDESTGRCFSLIFFKVRTASFSVSPAPDKIEEMVKGRGASWHASELRPNGVISLDDPAKGVLSIDEKVWRDCRGVPSRAGRAVRKFQKAHPGYEPVLCGGGRGVQSIYHPTREKAIQAIENALATDMWLIENEPIRTRRLGRAAEISIEDYSLLTKSPGRAKIMRALAQTEAAVTKGQKVLVCEHTGSLRIEVKQPKLEYPENLRMLVTFSTDGEPDGYAFARAGFYDLADQLAGEEVPRFDRSRYFAAGLPRYGQTMGPPQLAVPEGWRLRDCLGCQSGTSDKVYAWLTGPGEKQFVAYGRRDGTALVVRTVSRQYAEEAIYSRRGRYQAIDACDIPEFWNRVLSAFGRNK
jgi:hypothetical protein